MPGIVTVTEFVAETKDDVSSPTTSTFVSKMSQCRQTVAALEEILDADRDGLTKLKKAVKAIHSGGNAHTDNEMYLARALERLGTTALSKDQEPEIGAAFLKFSVVTKELSALLKTLMQNMNNIVLFPVESLLKGDLRGARGDLKRPFDRACKDYEAKYAKLEKEKKAQAKEAGLIRSEVSAAEVAEDLDFERKMFQLQMCEYLIKVNEIKTKKGVELLQHLVEYYHVQQNYFHDGLKTIEHFGSYINDLAQSLQKIRQKQDEERKQLVELRTLLKNSPGFEKDQNMTAGGGTVYSLHQLQGNKQHGMMRSGFLYKKSEGKMRKVWQKRKCEVRDGFLSIYHADESKPPTRVNLLTCQIKPVPEDKKSFDLVSYNRTYHFQAEEESDLIAWMSVLVNSKEGALMKAFDDNGRVGSKLSQGLFELQQAIIKYILRLPGNDRCADCCSNNDATWLSTNFGIIVCIECSGVHREMGVHVSRIQSLTLDHVTTSQLLIARHMSNHSFNEVMEATLHVPKPSANSSMEERSGFIRAKYIERKFAIRTSMDLRDLHSDVEHAIKNRDIHQLLQAFVEGADFSQPLIDNAIGETSLHMAIRRERGHSLHIVDFLVENSSTLTVPNAEGNTALHYCSLYNQAECMKLLLRSGANAAAENKDRKTPLDLAREHGATLCEELLQQASHQRKSVFENVNIDWNLSQDEGGSIDLSDDDTVIDNNLNGVATTDRRERSRPPSFGGRDSPVNLRSRSSTSESLRSGSSPNSLGHSTRPQTALFPPSTSLTNQNAATSSTASLKKPGGQQAAAAAGSLKKRAAPLPPMEASGRGQKVGGGPGHMRNASDHGVSLASHRMSMMVPGETSSRRSFAGDFGDVSSRTRSTSQSPANLPGAKLVLPRGELVPQLRNLQGSTSSIASVGRPRGPPPPTPGVAGVVASNLSPQQRANPSPTASPPTTPTSTASPSVYYSAKSHTATSPKHPLNGSPYESRNDGSPIDSLVASANQSLRGRRCRALYDCEADNEDEVSFREGEILVITQEKTEDENWMEGYVESQPERRGVFPVSFIHMLSD